MRPHKRNGREAKLRRQQDAYKRNEETRDWLRREATAEIFGAQEECMECGASKFINRDCQTPHCKAMREEPSAFYDEVTDDYIQINGSRMYAGLDY